MSDEALKDIIFAVFGVIGLAVGLFFGQRYNKKRNR